MNLLASPSPIPIGGQPETASSGAILLLISLLLMTLFTSYFLQLTRTKLIHETVVSIVLGLFVGFVIRIMGDANVMEMVSFDHSYFFNLLLPPIILNSGYEMRRKDFFRNIGTILVFAIIGTLISTVIIGTMVFIYAWTGISGLSMTYLDCLVFGAGKLF